VRRTYEQGRGALSICSVRMQLVRHAIAMAYAKGIGGTCAGILETSFGKETDLFGEQAVYVGLECAD